MVEPTLFAVGEGFGKPQQILAIVGGAAVGAFVFGLIAQLLTRWLTTKPMPPFAVNTIRLVGAVLFGLLTAMWVWQGGGWGPGGLGGPGNSEGTGVGDVKHDADNGTTKEPEASQEPSKAPDKEQRAPAEAVLRIEALPDSALTDYDKGEQRYYKVEGEDAPHPHTLVEMRDLIRKRIDDKPPLRRLDIVTRPNSPARDAGRVSRLRDVITSLAPDLNVEYPPR